MYLGIDLGTSSIKFVLIDDDHNMCFTHDEPLTISHPHPLWSEQNPQDWWIALEKGFAELVQHNLGKNIKGIGFSGQMHGAVLLDDKGEVLRPAILWNDGRCAEECKQINDLSVKITGNLAMPGFTAGKLLWVEKYEPQIFAKIDKILLPKDYLRWRMSGVFATDMSDASGTLWLDIAKRCWSKEMLAACHLNEGQMPDLFEGCQPTATLTPQLAQLWGMECVPLVAGAGDNAAGAIGCGIIHPDQAMLSLGTSGVYFVASDGFLRNPQKAVHSFCHALPDRWHLMSVILNAAGCLDWGAKMLGLADVATFIDVAQQAETEVHNPIFLPYLAGERTPLNDPYACGVFYGLSAGHRNANMAWAIIEGVSFALADAMDALHETGIRPQSATIIGGGARSAFWRQLLADISGIDLDYHQGGTVGPALGAAILAQIALNPNGSVEQFCPQPPLIAQHKSNGEKYNSFLPRREKFRAIYHALKDI
ncbi:xylulokinase [Bartonella sp. HY329]|uniref:xylulokinase n=1 Tax=unclassified Bartonella TaxID=2645622 RepID=UPI0021C5F643|nr:MULTISPECIES: xylulokinase [unclassified Bartonella]UXM94901.1 xylulokinase [Bartonella sp. HY329]UXN09224.1 xylulokinase [Bartonella sp. HY328]